MIARWVAVAAVLVAVGSGDLWLQLHKPDHKYRLAVTVETPTGPVRAASVIAVHSDKSPFGGNDDRPSITGDAVFVDLGGGRNLVALLALGRHAEDPDGIGNLAQRAFARDHRAVSFQDVRLLSGSVPLRGRLTPALVSFADPSDAASAQWLEPDNLERVLGRGYRLISVTLEIVPLGFWPFDLGGMLGEGATRGIEQKLPWLAAADPGAACSAFDDRRLDARLVTRSAVTPCQRFEGETGRQFNGSELGGSS